MLQSFVIMLREGAEAALAVAILLVAIQRSGHGKLARAVWIGFGLALAASVAASFPLRLLAVTEELYGGILYFVTAAFLLSMMWWVRRSSKTFRRGLENRVESAANSAGSGKGLRAALGLGTLAFVMVLREGIETVLLLSAMSLTTDALLEAAGILLGVAVSIGFGWMFVKGSSRVDLRRFFGITQSVLVLFVVQLLVNGYHELSEIGLLPATPRSMALIGLVVRNNTLFTIAVVAIPLFAWLARKPGERATGAAEASAAERRLAAASARRERLYRHGAVVSSLVVLAFVGVLYAGEAIPKKMQPPEIVSAEAGRVRVSLDRLEAGKLGRFGTVVQGRLVRFLAMKGADGKVRTALDACANCGAFGYVQDEKSGNLVCLNCGAEIDPTTLGHEGGCNPIPLKSATNGTSVEVGVSDLETHAQLFSAAPEQELVAIDPVCGMQVPIHGSSAFEKYQGKNYYFCSMPGSRCHELFRHDPAKFVQ